MTYHDLLIMIIIGVIFLILGLIGFLWGSKEEGSWYSVISERIDVREFLERLPGRPEPDALRIGGKICIAVGIVILLVCLGFYLWGMKPTP
jgi:nitrogen fixation-related uncharacterized protein